MKANLLALFLFISTVSVAQQQGVIMKGLDTLAITGPQSSYYIEFLNTVSPKDLHFICTSYKDNRFSFKYKADLIATMSEYIDNQATTNWVLTKNEKILLKEFEKIQFREWKNSKSKPSNNISAGDHLQRAGRYKNASVAVLLGSGTTAYALIAADPINRPTASIIGVAGGLVSLGLNIAGNMELIAAGKAMNKE
jgi:hypothetical protein